MPVMRGVGILFFTISLIFFALVLRDYRLHGKAMTIARKVRLRLALIFAIVGVGLIIYSTFL